MKSGKKRIKNNQVVPAQNQVPLEQLHALSNVMSRIALSNQLGVGYDGSRDLFKTLGYKETLDYDDYHDMWKRGDVAKVVIEKVPKKCWSNLPIITDTEEGNSTFSEAVQQLFKDFNIIQIMSRADKLMRMGRYSVLFLGFNGTTMKGLSSEVVVSKGLELLYTTPFSEKVAKVHSLVTDPNNPRYGKPLLYQIDFNSTYQPDAIEGHTTGAIVTEVENKVLVHYSRIIHLTENILENEIEGTPVLEAIYNRLQDIQKILGGSGEMFWRNAAPGKVASTKENATLSKTTADDLRKQFDEYEHNLRRWLTVEGIDVKSLETYMTSPRDFMEVQLNIIAIVTNIPKRILMGSERGELASSQDQDSFNALIHERCNEECTPVFIKQFVDRMIQFGLLPAPKNEEYMTIWPKQTALGAKDKSEIALNRAKAIKEYVSSPGANILIPERIWMREELGYNELQIKEIEKARGNLVLDTDIDDEPGNTEPSTSNEE